MSNIINSIRPVPGTTINLHDKSTITRTSSDANSSDSPVFLCASAADKGTEKLTRYDSLDAWRSAHLNNGEVNFNKYGLPLYSADELLESGASIYFKRIVAEDATLANAAVVAILDRNKTQKVNEAGLPLYYDQKGAETTSPTSMILNPNFAGTPSTTLVTLDNNSIASMASEFMIQLANDTFEGLTKGDDITSWAKVSTRSRNNPLAGLAFKIKEVASDTISVETEVTSVVEIDNTITFTIPKENLTSGREDVKFDLTVKITTEQTPEGQIVDKVVENLESTGNSEELVTPSQPQDEQPSTGGIEELTRSARTTTVNTTDEFISVNNTPIYESKTSLQFAVKYVENAKTMAEVVKEISSLYTEPEMIQEEDETPSVSDFVINDVVLDETSNDNSNEGIVITKDSYIIPLFVLADLGRGSSKRRFRISPNYTSSKYKNYFLNNIEIIENGTILNSLQFSFDPNYTVYNTSKGISKALDGNSNVQVTVFEDYYDTFFTVLEEFSGITRDEINASVAITVGTDKNKNTLSNLEVSGVNLAHTYGIKLSGGSYGSWGTGNNISVLDNKEYIDSLTSFYKGELDDEIWKREELFFNFICDAAFPQEVKRAIEYFCTTRQDVSCLLDMGTEITEYDEFINSVNDYAKTHFSSIYYQYGQIYNKFNNKRITTTLPMLIGKKLKTHLSNGASLPIAGRVYGFTFPDLIEDSIIHTPRHTPSINQKEELIEAQINFGSIQNNVFTLETYYTNNEGHTQLSYSSNIFAIQALMQDIIKAAAEVRYLGMDSTQLAIQSDKYNVICNRHASNFESCVFEYVGTEEDELNKSYMGQISVVCKNFTINETFDIFVINQDSEDVYTISI